MSISEAEHDRRAEIVERIIINAIAGSDQRFVLLLTLLDWPGGWLSLFVKIVLLPPGSIPDCTRVAFADAWCPRGPDMIPMIRDHWIICDLAAHQPIMCAALRILMPPVSKDQIPLVLFRGQTLGEHERGEIGIWWTYEPRIAEWYARSSLRTATGPRVILAGLDPGHAIISQRGVETFVDPTLLKRIEIIAAPPPYSDEEEISLGLDLDLDATSVLNRVPHGFATEAVEEWRLRAKAAA